MITTWQNKTLSALFLWIAPCSLYSNPLRIPQNAHYPVSWDEMTGVWNLKRQTHTDYISSTATYVLQILSSGKVCESLQIRTYFKPDGKIEKSKGDPLCEDPGPHFFPTIDEYIRSISWISNDYNKMYTKLRDHFANGSPWTSVNWQWEANENLTCPQSTASEVTKNKLRTMEYAILYKSNPELFKWAGMAAFASDTVGLGIRFSEFFSDKPLLNQRANNMLALLTAGNKAVYEDIYWQHEAYRLGGIEEIKRQFKKGQISPSQMKAWEQIKLGYQQANADLIWSGNQGLLRHEQEVTLQAIYDRYPDISKEISPFMYSPIPENSSDLFYFTVPSGNIGVFNDRWEWISSALLPSWKDLSENQALSAFDAIDSLITSNKGACNNEN